ncbi:MAG: menaquinone reductase multiheme cytochrome c subunit QrcA [Desulfovibrionales bacterium]
MEEKKVSKKSLGIVPFTIGLVGALIVGWWVFPQILFSEKAQPINFNHPLHMDQGLDCDSCHYYREDGSFAGMPTTESCMDCHFDVMDPDNPNDVKFIEEYVFPEKEIPWIVYQHQPDNVYFSHIVHEPFDCTDCHPDVASMEELPKVSVNRLTKYTKQTMTMDECERCHAENGASNACFVCHK